MTTDCIVKSSPVGSLAEWHSTQYVEKKPMAQLPQVSPEASGEGASCAPGASASLESKLAPSLANEPESFELPADEPPDEHAVASRAETDRRRNLIDDILDWPRGFDVVILRGAPLQDRRSRAAGAAADSLRGSYASPRPPFGPRLSRSD
jgi:hypothetical protein